MLHAIHLIPGIGFGRELTHKHPTPLTAVAEIDVGHTHVVPKLLQLPENSLERCCSGISARVRLATGKDAARTEYRRCGMGESGVLVPGTTKFSAVTGAGADA